MAQSPLPKPPRTAEKFGREINDWFTRLYRRISDDLQLVWTQIDTAGSSLDDLTIKAHDLLTDLGEVDPTDTDAARNKHVSNADGKAWQDTKTAYDTHAAASNAHGATGDLVGTGDTATAVTAGVVLKAAASTDAAASAVSVTSANVSAAPATYTQAWGGEVVTLCNEMKADINTLVTDVNAIKDSLNDLRTKLRNAGMLST